MNVGKGERGESSETFGLGFMNDTDRIDDSGVIVQLIIKNFLFKGVVSVAIKPHASPLPTTLPSPTFLVDHGLGGGASASNAPGDAAAFRVLAEKMIQKTTTKEGATTI